MVGGLLVLNFLLIAFQRNVDFAFEVMGAKNAFVAFVVFGFGIQVYALWAASDVWRAAGSYSGSAIWKVSSRILAVLVALLTILSLVNMYYALTTDI